MGSRHEALVISVLVHELINEEPPLAKGHGSCTWEHMYYQRQVPRLCALALGLLST